VLRHCREGDGDGHDPDGGGQQGGLLPARLRAPVSGPGQQRRQTAAHRREERRQAQDHQQVLHRSSCVFRLNRPSLVNEGDPAVIWGL